MKNYFSNQDIINFIRYIQSKYPVEDWKIGDISFWPIIKNNMPFFVYKTFSVSKSDDYSDEKDRYINKYIKIIFKFFFCVIHVLKQIIFLFFERKEGKIIMVGDGVSKIAVNGKLVDKFVYPFVESHKEKNFLVFEQNLNPSETEKEYLNLSYLEYVCYILARFLWRIPMHSSFDMYEFFLEEASKKFDVSYISTKNIKINVLQIIFMSHFFKWLIKRYSVKTAYVVCYYGTIGYALSRACKHSGAVCFDIEHGSIFNASPYCAWDKIPDAGYDILPQGYLLWHPFLKNYFMTQNSKKFLANKIIREDGMSIISSVPSNRLFQEYISKTRENYDTIILVTLQPQFYVIDDWAKLSAVIPMFHNKIFWIIRSHPVYRCQATEEIKSKVSHLDNVLIDEAKINIYDLFKNVDLHITTASASIIEAAVFNVKTILISIVGLENFGYFIEKNLAVYAESIEKIYEEIEKCTHPNQ